MTVLIDFLIGAFVAATLMTAAHFAGRARRYVLWTVRCRRGRRCADLVTDHVRMTDEDGEEIDYAGASMVMRMTYTCAACGTTYRSEVISGGTGRWTPTGRERVP